MEPLTIIAGPCALDTIDNARAVAGKLCELKRGLYPRYDVDFIFKGSFDKANRTSAMSERGIGIKQGLQILEDIKLMYKLKVTTDIHECWQAKEVSQIVDIIQIPAFLSRQTDLIEAVCKEDVQINIKKGQWMDFNEINEAGYKAWDFYKKHKACHNEPWLTDRGTSFGYGLVNDFRTVYNMCSQWTTIFDATHSCQKSHIKYAVPLARAALAVGVNGLFFEVHPDPKQSISDQDNMIKLDDFEETLERILE